MKAATAMPISAFGTSVPTFFIRDMPASSESSPASMKSTRIGADHDPHGVDGHRFPEHAVVGGVE